MITACLAGQPSPAWNEGPEETDGGGCREPVQNLLVKKGCRECVQRHNLNTTKTKHKSFLKNHPFTKPENHLSVVMLRIRSEE